MRQPKNALEIYKLLEQSSCGKCGEKTCLVLLPGRSSWGRKASANARIGPGGQTVAERELGWNRGTIRKGMHELTAGVECKDAFCLRGRTRSDKRLANLLDDIRDIVDSNAQVDATLRTPRLYLKMTARQVRTQLIEQKHYKDEDLPKRRTNSTILNKLGYRLRKVKKQTTEESPCNERHL